MTHETDDATEPKGLDRFDPTQRAFVVTHVLNGKPSGGADPGTGPAEADGEASEPEQDKRIEGLHYGAGMEYLYDQAGLNAIKDLPPPAGLVAALSTPEIIGSDDYAAVGAAADSDLAAFHASSAATLAMMCAPDTTIGDAALAALPVVDAPRNNPERAQVAAHLAALENLESGHAMRLLQTKPGEQSALMQEFNREKLGILQEMRTDVIDWMNRRSHQSLPPSTEALAMADLVVREQRKLMEDYVDPSKGMGLPPALDSDDLTDAERTELSATWTRLIDGSSNLRIPATVPDATDPDYARYHEIVTDSGSRDFAPGQELPTNEEQARFRLQMLTAMTELLTTTAGREIVSRIEATGKPVRFAPIPLSASADVGIDDDDGSKADVPGASDLNKPAPIAGTGSMVGFSIDMVSSTEMYWDSDLVGIFTPISVIMGHELTHSMHSAEGIGRFNINKRQTEDALEGYDLSDFDMVGEDTTTGEKTYKLKSYWSNFEEYFTIKKDLISEQTLRQSMGLSRDRTGHGFTDGSDNMKTASIAAVDATQKIEALTDSAGDKLDIDAFLETERRFRRETISKMDDKIKLAIHGDPDCKGPLPPGWSPMRLTVDKIKRIQADKLPYRMAMLGWTSYDLPYDGGSADPVMGFAKTIKGITISRMSHPRSTLGRNFQTLGGRRIFDRFPAIKSAIGASLGSWSASNWPTNLHTLVAADRTLKELVQRTPVVSAGFVADRQDSLETRANKIKALLDAALPPGDVAKAGALFADDALSYFDIRDTDPAKQVAALKTEEGRLPSEVAELATVGLATAEMSLVARHKAAQALKAFRAKDAVTNCRKLSLELDKVIGDKSKVQEAQTIYSRMLSEFEMMSLDLKAISPVAVADAIRQLVVLPLDQDILGREDYAELVEAATAKMEERAAEALAEVEELRDVLSNFHLEEKLGAYIGEKVPNGEDFWAFRDALYGRRRDGMLDLVHGADLVKSGLSRNTVALLRRDPSDPDVLKSADAEVQAIVEAHLDGFLSQERAAV